MMMNEKTFLTKSHWKCPARLEIKDMDWSHDPNRLKETMLEDKTNDEPTAYCKLYGEGETLSICQLLRANEECPVLGDLRTKIKALKGKQAKEKQKENEMNEMDKMNNDNRPRTTTLTHVKEIIDILNKHGITMDSIRMPMKKGEIDNA